MNARRDQMTMSDEEVAQFLESQWLMVMGTNRSNGFPHLVTMAYTMWNGQITFSSYRKAQKVVNLQRDPRISCLIEDVGTQYSEIKGVLIEGGVSFITDPEVQLERNAAKTRQVKHGQAAKPLEEMVDKRVLVVVEPHHVSSWDHSRLGGVY